MSDAKDPVTGRSFDGHYDEVLDCGCVVFYHGGTARCAPCAAGLPSAGEAVAVDAVRLSPERKA